MSLFVLRIDTGEAKITCPEDLAVLVSEQALRLLTLATDISYKLPVRTDGDECGEIELLANWEPVEDNEL